MEKLKELGKIGDKVNKAMEVVWAVGLTIKELDALEEYIRHQETLAPLLNPGFVQKNGFKLIDEAKKRIELLKPIVGLKERL